MDKTFNFYGSIIILPLTLFLHFNMASSYDKYKLYKPVIPYF